MLFEIKSSRQQIIIDSKNVILELMQHRAERLSDESLALPPIHYTILSTLTVLILIGYGVSILPSLNDGSPPPSESSIIFATFCSIYTRFYFFAQDLNQPFRGVYLIRRSSAAAHLLQLKWLFTNHKLVRTFFFYSHFFFNSMHITK